MKNSEHCHVISSFTHCMKYGEHCHVTSSFTHCMKYGEHCPVTSFSSQCSQNTHTHTHKASPWPCHAAWLLRLLSSSALLEIQAFHSCKLVATWNPNCARPRRLADGKLLESGKLHSHPVPSYRGYVLWGVSFVWVLGCRSRVQIFTRRPATWSASWIRPWRR